MLKLITWIFSTYTMNVLYLWFTLQLFQFSNTRFNNNAKRHTIPIVRSGDVIVSKCMWSNCLCIHIPNKRFGALWTFLMRQENHMQSIIKIYILLIVIQQIFILIACYIISHVLHLLAYITRIKKDTKSHTQNKIKLTLYLHKYENNPCMHSVNKPWIKEKQMHQGQN